MKLFAENKESHEEQSRILHRLYTIMFPLQLVIYLCLIKKVYRTKIDFIAIFLLSVYMITFFMKFLWGLELLDQYDNMKLDYLISYICKTLITIGLVMLIFEMQKVRQLIKAMSHKIYLSQVVKIKNYKIGFLVFFIPLECWSIYTQIALIDAKTPNESISIQRIVHTSIFVPIHLSIIVWFLVTIRFYVLQHREKGDNFTFKKKAIVACILFLTFSEFMHSPNMIITRTITIKYFDKKDQPEWYSLYRFIMVGIVATFANFFESLMICYMTLSFSKQQEVKQNSNVSLESIMRNESIQEESRTAYRENLQQEEFNINSTIINKHAEKLSPDIHSLRMSKDSEEDGDSYMLFKSASIGMERFYEFLEKITSRKPQSKLRDSTIEEYTEVSSSLND